MKDRQNFIKTLRQEIMQDPVFEKELTDDQMQEVISRYLLRKGVESGLSLQERKLMGKELFYSLRKLDVLQELMEDDRVTEIMVNGPSHIYVEKEGKITRLNAEFESGEKLLQVIRQIVSGCNRTVNEASPIVDARLPGGARVNVVLYPVALNGPILTIRRFSDTPMTMERLKEYKAISREAIDFLTKAVKARYNILVSGGTGSGKTTFLNALSQFIPADERVITIEDSAELRLWGVENLIRMETRNANLEEGKPITIRDLIRASLRMRPDRIIVGEVRGAEALDMIGSAMNCGHDGSMSTAHANSATDMLLRLETMILMGVELPVSAIRRQIASGIDLVVHLGRLRDKSRKVLEITEIVGMKDEQILLNPLFRFREEGRDKQGNVEGGLIKVGQLTNRYKMESAGLSFP